LGALESPWGFSDFSALHAELDVICPLVSLNKFLQTMHQTAKESLATSGGAVDSRAPGGRPLHPVDGNLCIKESR
jgi:hypothetical protein